MFATAGMRRSAAVAAQLDARVPPHTITAFAIAGKPIVPVFHVGAAMGAAMTGLRPVAEIMFSDFFGVCWDLIANQIAKTRYMTDGQIALPLVIKNTFPEFLAQHAFIDQVRQNKLEGWKGPAGPFVYLILRSDAVDVVYGTMAGYEALNIPYMAHIAPTNKW